MVGVGDHAQDLSGDWFLRMEGPQGLVHMTLKLAQDGAQLRGTAEGPMGSSELTGDVDGEGVRFVVRIDSGPGFEMHFSGALVRDADGEQRLRGTMRSGEVSAEFSAERLRRS